MQTLYIDVFFLINFTVDILSLYFASMFSKTPTTTPRLIIAALLGGFVAIITVFLSEIFWLKIIVSGAGLFIIGYITPRHTGIKRKMKYIFAFIIFEALIGGIVSFAWEFLDENVAHIFDGVASGAVNRKMLFFSLIILLSIGVLKMIVSFFSNIESEGNIEVEISFFEKKTVLTAFIDSGNLAIDPMDMSPILLIKKEAAKSFLPENIIDLLNIDLLERKVKKRIRLIPISRGGATHVLIGVKADYVALKRGERLEEIKVTVAIDKEGGSYGGYQALMPSAALDNAVTK